MSQAFLDTSVLIELPDTMIDSLWECCSSQLCRGELLRGKNRFEATGSVSAVTQRAAFVAALDSIPGFWRDFDRGAATSYGALRVTAEQHARRKDALIAAHAHSLGLPVLTMDTDFSHFPEVEVQIVDSQ